MIFLIQSATERKKMDYIPLAFATLAGMNFGSAAYLLSPQPNLVGAMNIGVGVFVALLGILRRIPVV